MGDGTTAAVLPAPPLPEDLDLQDFQFIPLDAVRLRDSTLATEATGEEFRAAVLLWCVAWHQVPAASLPNSEPSLAQYAGFGRDLKGWKKIRTGAMRGFNLCSDGRLYHLVLAEKALEAWEGKLKRRHGRECERIKKAAQRADTKPVYPSFDEWKANLAATGSDRWEPEVVPGTDDDVSQGTNEGHDDTRPEGQAGDVPIVSQPPKGQGTGTGDRDSGEGQGKEHQDSLRSSSSTTASPTNPTPPETAEQRKARLAAEASQRLSVHTANAMTAYNAILARPRGVLSRATDVAIEERRKDVKRCLRVASRICKREYDSEVITAEFWQDYFHLVNDDEFKSGRQKPGHGHANWKPDFEYLTRPDTVAQVYERVLAGDDGEGTTVDGEADE